MEPRPSLRTPPRARTRKESSAGSPPSATSHDTPARGVRYSVSARMRPLARPDAIAAKMVLRVVEFCRKRGHDADALCRGVGLTLEVLSEPDARVDYATVARLGVRALAVTRDQNFGLHLAQDVQDTGSFDAGLLLLMASPSVRVAFERMASYQRYWGDGNRATLHAAAGGLTVRYVLAGAEGEYARHSYECAMAEIALGARVLTGKPLLPRTVRFRHAAPRETGEHHQLFGCTLEFGAAYDEITFDDAVLDEPMPHANAAFCAIFEQQVEKALARLPATTTASGAVREVARAALAGGRCTLNGTASALSVSVRTLQRRLPEARGDVVRRRRGCTPPRTRVRLLGPRRSGPPQWRPSSASTRTPRRFTACIPPLDPARALHGIDLSMPKIEGISRFALCEPRLWYLLRSASSPRAVAPIGARPASTVLRMPTLTAPHGGFSQMAGETRKELRQIEAAPAPRITESWGGLASRYRAVAGGLTRLHGAVRRAAPAVGAVRRVFARGAPEPVRITADQ